ncbi:MAG: class I SAM-dependent methyltransferase, partial [Sulfuricellaceae bacterium]|nr:class I SAM-dependent methyltransferase [Sulfuricellaceae bacterium]
MKSERLLDAEKKRLPPSIMAFLLQAISLILVLALILPVLEHWTGPLPTPAVALMIGCGAAFLGIFAAMSSWWLPINLIFPLIVVLALPLGIPPLVYLIVFFLLMAIYRGVVLDRVPLYLSSKKARYAVLENLPEQAGSRFIDLGSGLGGLLMFLAERQPQGIFSGVESALLPYWFSRIRLFPLRQNCHVLWNNMWAIKLSEYDVIY